MLHLLCFVTNVFSSRLAGHCSSTEDVVAVVKACSKHSVPVTPYAAGTSLEGHTTTPRGGISINMTRMDVRMQENAGKNTMLVSLAHAVRTSCTSFILCDTNGSFCSQLANAAGLIMQVLQ